MSFSQPSPENSLNQSALSAHEIEKRLENLEAHLGCVWRGFARAGGPALNVGGISHGLGVCTE